MPCVGFPHNEVSSVDHIDRNRTNNHPQNLRWASGTEQNLNRILCQKREDLIAQIKDGLIIDFYEKRSLLEIFDIDEIEIPNKGLFYNGYLWINERFTDLDMINESWVQINVCDINIEISNMGRVKNNRGKTFGSLTSSGYKRTKISGKDFFVHRLVISAFRGHISENLVVNHIDRNKENNRLDNLEVITPSENTTHAVNSGTNMTKPILQINANNDVIAKFPSIREANKATKIYYTGIAEVARGERKTAGGFTWKFV